MTLGNVVGGSIMVAAVYYLIYRRALKAPPDRAGQGQAVRLNAVYGVGIAVERVAEPHQAAHRIVAGCHGPTPSPAAESRRGGA